MDKTPEELLEYTIGMRKRGDSYRTILSYLNLHCDDPEIREEVLENLDKLEDKGRVRPKKVFSRARSSSIHMAIVTLISLCLIVTLTAVLLKRGWLYSIPMIFLLGAFLMFLQKLRM